MLTIQGKQPPAPSCSEAPWVMTGEWARKRVHAGSLPAEEATGAALASPRQPVLFLDPGVGDIKEFLFQQDACIDKNVGLE